MATIIFTNNNNPNPGLEDVLDQNGDIITANATTFEIRNNNGGASNNFIFRFTSADRISPSPAPRRPAARSPASRSWMRPAAMRSSQSVTIPNQGLVIFYDHTAKPRRYRRVGRSCSAGDSAATPASNTYTGSNGIDHLTTFGLNGITCPDIETLNGGGGNDVLTYLAGSATLVGGTGNDTFVIAATLDRSFCPQTY